MTRYGLSQTQLARELKVDPSYISRIRKGDRVNLSERVLERLDVVERRGPGINLTESMTESFGLNPRALLKEAREQAGMTRADLAKRIGYEVGVIQAIEDNGARITEKMVDAICKVLPLEKDDLLAGSDHPPISSDGGGLRRTVGQKPNISLPPGMSAKVIPLISWAQAGTLHSFWDDAYQYEGIIALNVTDRKAFGVTIRGDSMRPQYDEGDVVILTPSSEARNGDLVIARLKEESGDDVMFKIFQSTGGGQRVVLSSYNPAFPALEFSRSDFRWIYPAQSVIKTIRK